MHTPDRRMSKVSFIMVCAAKGSCLYMLSDRLSFANEWRIAEAELYFSVSSLSW